MKSGFGVILLLVLLIVGNYAVQNIREEKDSVTLSDVRNMCAVYPALACNAGLSEYTTFEDAVVFNAPPGKCGEAIFGTRYNTGGQSEHAYIVWTDCDGVMHRGSPDFVSGQMIIFNTPD